MYKLGVGLAVLGLILMIAGIVAGTHPSAVEKATSVERSGVVVEGEYNIPPLSSKTFQFEVPPSAENPSLHLQVKGGGVTIKVETNTGTKVYEEKIDVYAVRDINLPGPSLYQLKITNGLSMSTKHVSITATLHYTESIVEKHTSENTLAVDLSLGGIILFAIGAAIAIIAKLYSWRKTRK